MRYAAAVLLLAAQDLGKEELRETLADAAPKGAWIYDDLAAARAAAATAGKPIFAVARCVP